jgi:N-acetylmuramoyl-L-alanine amidase
MTLRMNRLAKLALMMIIMVLSGTAAAFAGTGQIKINLDGVDIACDSPPVIVDGRTLVPARAVFEAMGGKVEWNDATREVAVTVRDVKVNLKIDSKTAYINGSDKQLEVPAQIIKNRTMIPVRFVSEAVGCEVSWDQNNRIVGIVSPSNQAEELTVIGSIGLSQEGNRVTVDADREITDISTIKMSNPSRLVFDISNAKLGISDGAINTGENPFFKAIRYSQYTKDSVRIVADLTMYSSGTASRSDSMRTAYLTFKVNEPEALGDVIEPDGNISIEDQAILDQYGLEPVKAEAQRKIVVIDPGHGGSDTGSRGFENGVAVLNEKDVNLDVALRVQKMLEAAGARIYMIRTDDVTIPLYDRQDTANLLGASLYVAIHNNSYTNGTPSGTEVHYHGQSDSPLDGISAMELAENLQSTLASNLGLPNRGTKVSPELAVLRRTVMPAVIIEGAFISNPNDLNYMKTDDFREKYAMSAAKCIIDELNRSVE